jgi:FKBP-type peptidyl-prolyl cis-trans isomerase FkpA
MSVTAVPLRPIAKGSIIRLWIGISALIAVGIALAWATTGRIVTMSLPPAEFMATNGAKSRVVTTASGLQYEVLSEGSGTKPGPQDIVRVHYEGKLLSGDTFDASKRHGDEPATLPVSGLIPGWVEGLQLMPKGAKYRFWIPPELGYGPQGAGNGVIPPNSVLVFDVTLEDIMPAPALGGMEGMMPPQGMR